MRVQGTNGIEFELEDSVATGMIAAGLLSAIDEDPSGASTGEGKSQPPVDEDPQPPVDEDPQPPVDEDPQPPEDEDAKKAKK